MPQMHEQGTVVTYPSNEADSLRDDLAMQTLPCDSSPDFQSSRGRARFPILFLLPVSYPRDRGTRPDHPML